VPLAGQFMPAAGAATIVDPCGQPRLSLRARRVRRRARPSLAALACRYVEAARAALTPDELGAMLATLGEGLPPRRASPARHPEVAELLRGIARTNAEPPARADAISADDLSAMLATLGEGRRALRDRALLTLGFAGAFRRSALVALELHDLSFVPNGLEVRVRADKGAGSARVVPIAPAMIADRCAVRSVRAWIAAAELRGGPLFRAIARSGAIGDRALSDRAVDRAVKCAARAAGIARRLSAHSLRAGFITSAVRQRHPLERIRVVSGHREGSRAFEAYVRFASLWDGYAGAGVL
jgi:integrase